MKDFMNTKKSTWLATVVALEVIALEISAYTYAALNYQEGSHILLLAIVLCVLGAIIGTIVTRPGAQVISSVLVVLGVAALCAGLYFVFHLHYHERASVVVGSGIMGIVGGLAGLLVPRSTIATLAGVIILGVATLGLGFYFLSVLAYHGRAYMVLGTGALCLLAGLVGIIMVAQHRSHPLLPDKRDRR